MAADNTSTLPPTETTPPSAPVPDQDFYTWTNFFSILSGSASPKERDAYFRARDVVNEDRDCARCVKDRDWLLKYSPVVRFMQHNISLLGGDLNGANIRCKRCTTAQSGGFDPEYGMLLCANQFRNRGHMEDTMAHEMVHAYDYLRFKLDPLDLRHAACMEVCMRLHAWMDGSRSREEAGLMRGVDSREYAVGRVPFWTRVLHARAVEDYATVAGVREEKSDAVRCEQARMQGRRPCGESRERGLGQLFQRHQTLR